MLIIIRVVVLMVEMILMTILLNLAIERNYNNDDKDNIMNAMNINMSMNI